MVYCYSIRLLTWQISFVEICNMVELSLEVKIVTNLTVA